MLLELMHRLVLAAKAQKVEMDKLEKAKKERTKVSLNRRNRIILFSLCV